MKCSVFNPDSKNKLPGAYITTQLTLLTYSRTQLTFLYLYRYHVSDLDRARGE